MVKEDEIPPHPNDIMHKHWYETLCRLRGAVVFLFGLVLWLALALGVAMEMFFSVMIVGDIGVRVCVGVILVPWILLFTAVLVDEMLDLGLDAMDLPCLGLFR